MITEYSVIKSKTLLTTILAVVVVIAIITPPITAVLAQDVFESQEDGCRLQVPQGWVIQDDNIMSSQPRSEVIATPSQL
jgi:K+-transporting ATPase c subunit